MKPRSTLALLTALLAIALVLPVGAGADEYTDVIEITFPVGGDDYRYSDSFHSHRSRGAHASTDIMAPEGTPVYAAMGGTIGWMSTPATSRCGYCLFVDGDDGREYGYIHFGPNDAGHEDKAFARAFQRGDRMERGELIGYVGCSGNASCSPGGHHLHFQIEDHGVTDPYGDPRRDPYPSLKAAEARGDVPGGTASAGTAEPQPQPDPGTAEDDQGPQAAPTMADFTDVRADSAHAENIATIVDQGVMTICERDRFCPSDVVTRGQMAVFLAAALGLEPAAHDFTDVPADGYLADAIGAIAGTGVTVGCADGTRYCPDDPVSRAEMATFFQRALDLQPVDANAFQDVPSGWVHTANIAAIAELGVTRGCAAGRFCPFAPISRQEMASFLARAFYDSQT